MATLLDKLYATVLLCSILKSILYLSIRTARKAVHNLISYTRNISSFTQVWGCGCWKCRPVLTCTALKYICLLFASGAHLNRGAQECQQHAWGDSVIVLDMFSDLSTVSGDSPAHSRFSTRQNGKLQQDYRKPHPYKCSSSSTGKRKFCNEEKQ